MTTVNRYSQGKIYKLIDNVTGMFYIGSTALKRLDQRKRGHLDTSIRHPDRKIYKYFTPEKLRSEDVEIIELEKVAVSSKRELEKIENEYIQREIKNILCLNTIPSVEDVLHNRNTREKYRKNNQDKIKEIWNNYYEENKEIIKERSRVYNAENKEDVKEKRKAYAQKNKESFNQRSLKYYNSHKDEISEKCKEKCTCICGAILRKTNLKRHQQSMKHINFTNKQNISPEKV